MIFYVRMDMPPNHYRRKRRTQWLVVRHTRTTSSVLSFKFSELSPCFPEGIFSLSDLERAETWNGSQKANMGKLSDHQSKTGVPDWYVNANFSSQFIRSEASFLMADWLVTVFSIALHPYAKTLHRLHRDSSHMSRSSSVPGSYSDISSTDTFVKGFPTSQR